MARFHDAELQHFDYFLITYGKEFHSQSMNYDSTISMMTTWIPDWGQSDFQYWVDITQHFGMKLLSTSDPALIPSIKTPTPLRSGFHLHHNHHHRTSNLEQLSSICPIQKPTNPFSMILPILKWKNSPHNQQILYRKNLHSTH